MAAKPNSVAFFANSIGQDRGPYQIFSRTCSLSLSPSFVNLEVTQLLTNLVCFVCFHLFIVATGCPSEPCFTEDGYLLRGIVQGYRRKLLRAPTCFLTCSVYSTVTQDLGL